MKTQVNILDLFPELSYEELKEVMDKWLNTDAEATDAAVPTTTASTASDDDEPPFTAPAKAATAAASSPTAAKAKGKDSVEQAFDDLFNS